MEDVVGLATKSRKTLANALPGETRPQPAPSDCLFYHTMEIPGLGLVQGQWDLRGSEARYLGNVALAGKTVLEIGPASGYLSFWMEGAGATVTSFDLDETQDWDIVPFAHLDFARVMQDRQNQIRQLNNSWWYARAALNARATCVYGTVYGIDAALGQFDVVTINSVLLHLRDPFLAIQRAAARCSGTMVITDVAESQFAAGASGGAGDLALHFIPRASTRQPIDAWWYIPSQLTVEILRVLGFSSTEVTFHQAKFGDGHLWDLYTVVATR